MIIKLSPTRSDAELVISKSGDELIINGVRLDFARLADGATLPAEAVGSDWIILPVERIGGDLIVTIMLPHRADALESVRFPADLYRPADGPLSLPGLDAPVAQEASSAGVIDWSQVISPAMKEQAAAEQHLAAVVAETATRRATADTAITPLQDAVDLDEATDEEVVALRAWKLYRVALNRLPAQEGYPTTIDWPALPA